MKRLKAHLEQGRFLTKKVFNKYVVNMDEESAEEFGETLEEEAFGGGEKFYQPLRDFLKRKAIEELESIPHGVHSGLRKEMIKGIFFYYKYSKDFHFWYLYDVISGEVIKHKTKILDFIACPPDEERVIPDFFEQVYEINKVILEDIERTYKEIEQKEGVDKGHVEMAKDKSTKFVALLIREIDLLIDDYLFDFPEDREVEREWEEIKDKLLKISPTKKRLSELRKIWKSYKNSHREWRKLIRALEEFVGQKSTYERFAPEPFNKDLLKLVAIDLIL